jgi:hypothetical protein
MQKLSQHVLEYSQTVALEREEDMRMQKAYEKPLRSTEAQALIREGERVLGIRVNLNYMMCPQQMSWARQSVQRGDVPTDARTDPEVLKRFADGQGDLLHHADGVADEQGVTAMMKMDFNSLRGCPKTHSALHDNFRCFLMTLAVLQDLTVPPADLWVKPLAIYVFLDEFGFHARSMPLPAAYRFRVNVLDELRSRVSDRVNLSSVLTDLSVWMKEKAIVIQYSSSGMAKTVADECPKCAKLGKELDDANVTIQSLKDKLLTAQAMRNTQHNAGGRGRSESRGRSTSRGRGWAGRDNSSDGGRRVRVASSPDLSKRRHPGRRSRSPAQGRGRR